MSKCRSVILAAVWEEQVFPLQSSTDKTGGGRNIELGQNLAIFSAKISRCPSQRSKKLPENFYSKCSSVQTAAWEHCKSATVISLKVGFKLPPSFSSLLFSGALISVYFFVSFNFCAVRLWAKWALLTRWSFFNYVGQICPLLTTYLVPTLCWHWWGNSFTFIRKILDIVDISSTTFLPHLVHVLKEWPLARLTGPLFHDLLVVFLRLGKLATNVTCTVGWD